MFIPQFISRNFLFIYRRDSDLRLVLSLKLLQFLSLCKSFLMSTLLLTLFFLRINIIILRRLLIFILKRDQKNLQTWFLLPHRLNSYTLQQLLQQLLFSFDLKIHRLFTLVFYQATHERSYSFSLSIIGISIRIVLKNAILRAN